MNKKNQKKFFILALISVFVITKLMWWTFFVSIFLTFSLPLLFILWKSVWKLRIIAIIIWLILIWIDFFLIILLIVPTKSYDINIKEYYQQKKNYMKIFIKDDKANLKSMAIMIKNNNKEWKKILLSNYKTWEKININENDKIYFVWKKEYKTYAVIYLWDDSILRITPWTKLNLSKITKNLNKIVDSQTIVELEQWNIWFHIIKLIKNSDNIQIKTWTWQSLIIRWTSWIVSKNKETTQVIWYEHFIEIKNQDNSTIISKWQWAIIKENKINIVKNIQEILKNIWLNNNIIKEFKDQDKKYINKMKENLIKYIKENVWTITWFEFYNNLQKWKIIIFSIRNKKYQEYAKNLINYEYLVWKWQEFTSKLAKNENLAFLASQLEKQKVKTSYLYNQVKNNIRNSDLYKTYIVNLWIEWKITDINDSLTKNTIEIYNKDYDKIFEDIDYRIDILIKKYLHF